jgi:Zn-dependent metalloprotease
MGRGHAVRVQQLAAGLPVIGGELVVTTDAANNLVSITGETTVSTPRSYDPVVSAADAAERALDRVSRAEHVSTSTLRASTPQLSVYDASLLGPGSAVARLVWRMEVGNGLDVRHYTLVDALRGAVVLDFSMINEAKELHVCDKANVRSASDACTDPAVRTLVGGTDSGSLGAVDVDAAFDNSSAFYDFLLAETGRDSLNGAGMALRSTVRYCDTTSSCPFNNAYWNGSQMVYGDGYAVADDVVGHELTHGVTEFGPGLVYYYQSGAINESISDVFGELFDQMHPGTDTPSTKWLLGEDLAGGAIRNMADPTLLSQPDSMTSLTYAADLAFTDNGGVHTNSGVGNKAAFLMTDGGALNGVTVTGIGPDKTMAVWYAATKLLTSGSDYADLAVALVQGCNSLVPGAGLTAADCTEVAHATAAVLMSVDPPHAPTKPAPVCPTGMTKALVWQDGFEPTGVIPSGETWGMGDWDGLPPWFAADYYASEKSYSMNAADLDRRSLSSLIPVTQPYRNAHRFAIPSDGRMTYLRFDHAYDFEAGWGANYDGGQVEYTTDAQVTATNRLDAGPLMIDPDPTVSSHGYNGTVAAGYGSPIAGEGAFVNYSNGYTSTRVNLTSLAGKSVIPMFTAAFDAASGSPRFPGWFIDNVEVYTCSLGTTSTSITQSATTLIAGGSATISGKLVTSGTSTVIPYYPVRLEWRKKGTSTWTLLATKSSLSTGAFSATVKPTASTEYRWRFLGTNGWIASTSATKAVLVRPAITETVNDSTIALRKSFTVSGRVLPRMDGQTIKLQRYYSGAWHTVTSTTLARYDTTRSKYAMTYVPTVRGTLRFRIYKPADAFHLSNSIAFNVTVS